MTLPRKSRLTFTRCPFFIAASPPSERVELAFGLVDVPELPMIVPAAFGFTPGSRSAREAGDTVVVVDGLELHELAPSVVDG
jgi:hypothetical protein